jgi:putative tryptophan/tyrosine transport system substrate-binding protein
MTLCARVRGRRRGGASRRPRFTFIVAVLFLVAAPLTAGAQQPGKPWRIGYLSLTSDGPSYKPWLGALRDGLRDLGYVDGKNVIIEQRYAAGQVERLSTLATELVRLNVDVLVAAPAGSALAARNATRAIPIVFIGEPDPVGTALVASLARPGGNVTGLADAHADLVPKRLELLKQVVPSATRVGILWNPGNPATASQLKIAEGAAPALGLTILPVAVKGPRPADLDRAFATIGKEHLGILFVVGDSTLGVQRDRIAELSIKHRLPTSASHSRWAEGGLLMSYGTDFVDLFRRSAILVDRILRGAKPAELPVEEPTKFEFVINMRTAKALGLPISPSLLSRADRVIE